MYHQLVTNQVPSIGFEPNWKLPNAKEPQFLLLGMGPQIESVASALIESLNGANVAGLRVGLASEVQQVPEQVRSIRVYKTDRIVHRAATDVTLRRQADDLYIKFDVRARSWLNYLRFLLYGCVFATLWCAVYGVFYRYTNVRESLVQAYTRQWAESSPGASRDAKLQGFTYDPTTKSWRRGPSITIADIFQRDPKLFLTQMGGPPTIIAVVLGVLLKFAPQAFLRFPCRLVGWPTPEEFNNLVHGHAAWVEAVLSLTLLKHFGVHENMKIGVGK